MRKLTDSQIISIMNLGTNPLIDYVDVSHHSSGNMHVTIEPKGDSNMTEVLGLLNEIFPVVQVEEEPFCTARKDGTYCNLYTVSGGVFKSISLHMVYSQKEIAPTAMGADAENRKETIQPNYTTESEVVANA